MEEFGYADIIFFALLAAYIISRLRTVLGQDDGNRIEPRSPFTSAQAAESKKETKKEKEVVKEEPTVVTPIKQFAEPEVKDTKIKNKIKKLKEIDPAFNLGHFLNGAEIAFEMVMESYTKGDKETLKNLLSKQLFKEFEAEITKRESAKKIQVSTLVAILQSEVVSIENKGKKTTITVDFKTEQITLTKDGKGKIIDGDPSDVEEVSDSWKFYRDLSSSDPNWEIIDTDS